jgi:hypothetical protein
MMDASELKVVVGALNGQRGLYVQILELAKRQSGFVATGDSEGLMAVLAARSRLIDQVTPHDRTLQPYKGRWQEVLDSLGAGDRVVLSGLLKEVQQLLADILLQDETDKESLVRQKSDIGTELKKAVTGSALNRAYGVKPRVGSVIG